MRTTLTLDDDVSVQLERLRRARDASMKDLVTEALRRGLREMTAKPKNRKPFRTQAFALGPRAECCSPTFATISTKSGNSIAVLHHASKGNPTYCSAKD